jgi:hypothetical protein
MAYVFVISLPLSLVYAHLPFLASNPRAVTPQRVADPNSLRATEQNLKNLEH